MSDSTSGASTLQLPDYLVIGAMLLISTLIGLYYRFTGGKQRTMEEYFVADRSVGVITLAIGLSVSFVSGISMIGFSAETYSHGIIFIMLTSGFFVSLPLIIMFYLPVFNKSNTLSVYEYLEKRFGSSVKTATSIVNTVHLTLYTAIATFAPALALEATAGLSGDTSILVIGCVCTFYSTLGGIKAVLITDILQAGLIVIGMSCAMGIALSNVDGGLYGAWDIASRFGRLKFYDFRLDPTIRHTTWNLLISSVCLNVLLYGVSQVQVQRCLTAKNLNTAIYALIICAFLTATMMSLAAFCGVILFAVYESCDPVTAGKISSFDKILPYFASDKMSQYPGTTGLLIAGIFSATLSTISATINSLAVITLEDYIKPVCKKFNIELSNERATKIGKLLALSFGAISIGFAFVCKSLGSIVNLALGLMGVVGGPVVGVFTLGMFTETANEIGAIFGQLMAVIPLIVITSGAPNEATNLPLHVHGCDNTTLLDVVASTTIASVLPPEEVAVPYIYRISYALYLPLGTFITVVTGYVASLIVNKFFPKYSCIPDPDLLIPSLAAKVKRRREDEKKATNQLFILQYREPHQGPDKQD
ncbi:putative sodium-dependent multivitamin transporter [Halictus rubicundus]|uniref:putative sodium-dependent multivitamin transporter n=1 Tax=Halictus rubicundus TaxID=77578 RepID=UPI0040358D2B